MSRSLFFCFIFILGLFAACENARENNDVKSEIFVDQNADSFAVMEQHEEEFTDPRQTEVWDPEPAIIDFDINGVPSDAIVLFDGKNLNAWESVKDSIVNAPWLVNRDGSMTVAPGSGNIRTKESFGDIQMHLEWRVPQKAEGEGQERGNSGIFLQGRYEVQLLDSYQNRTYANGQAASLYKQQSPLVNATKPTKEWQVYDLIYHQPIFDSEGKKTAFGTLTLLHNGVLVQDDVTVEGTTEYIGKPKNLPHTAAPLQLQDHNNTMSFRNIWIRKI